MNVSPDFSAPIKLMKPYFMLSGFFYLASMILLFFINPQNSFSDFSIVSWVHVYMLGFVMMAIFSAMAQLGPVVVETKHHNVNVFKYIWIFLMFGLLLMIGGFYIYTKLLVYGGLLVLVAMSIYAIKFFMTLKKARRKTSITNAMKMSNLFLLLGIVSGLIMALSFSGYIEINPHSILKAHTFGLVVGFVILLIMGISIILVPMFGFSKRISDNEFSKSFYTLSLGVILMLLSPFFLSVYLENLAYILTIVAVLLYFYQLFKMTKSRKKVIHDVWARSMYVGFSSFIISFILLASYMFNESELILKLGIWIMFIGFFGFLIIGNFYKIIPFLVWFQIYSPLIEEQSVPMLHELLPNKLPNIQWFFSTLGLVVSSLGLLNKGVFLFYAGVILLTIGGFLFVISINKILNIKT
jgi:Ca2+/Na+ antiporter